MDKSKASNIVIVSPEFKTQLNHWRYSLILATLNVNEPMNTNPKSSSYIWKQRVLALRTLIILIGGLLLLAGASSVKAGTGIDTWNGAAGDNNWNTAGNWALNSSNTPPAVGDTPA